MTDVLIHALEVANFRSIKGKITAPLDAKVVLVHGENGAGKTSLLSAIELALTGRVISLQRADPQYFTQLLHRPLLQGQTQEGFIDLRTQGLEGANQFRALINGTGVKTDEVLPATLASFFGERCYLPQALLGQLLQIYQESDSTPDSPLAQFVTELLGLDRLDAIETGLMPVGHIRNLRKIAGRYSEVENERTRLELTFAEHRRTRDAADSAFKAALSDLNAARQTLGFVESIEESNLSGVDEALRLAPEEAELSGLHDQRRRLDAIRREADRDVDVEAREDEAALVEKHSDASERLKSWWQQFGAPLAALRERVRKVSPDAGFEEADLIEYYREASEKVSLQLRQAIERRTVNERDKTRWEQIEKTLSNLRKNLETIDVEIGRIAENSGNLGAALAELSSFIDGDICPVCDRDFSEEKKGSLAQHIGHKVRSLSSASERLLGLSRTRATVQVQIAQLEREGREIAPRLLDQVSFVELDRLVVELQALSSDFENLKEAIGQGTALSLAETHARQALSASQAGDLTRRATMASLTQFAAAYNQIEPGPHDTPQAVVTRLVAAIDDRIGSLNRHVVARTRARAALGQAMLELSRRQDADVRVATERAAQKRVSNALRRAKRVRKDAQVVKGEVEDVRSRIIGREFNGRLNRLWRDLFVRLAPNEPFIPAFKIPEEPTHRLQPKLITIHRSRSAEATGGAPGAMLSAGNLNTAALTLFLALHLTVKNQLPWLILDDPVQSMDDIHIAHFAALLRTLSKQHSRQIIVGVHDRQLFEYLRLELSPAFPGDSLRTLELSRGHTRDTLCIPDRRVFKEETAIRSAA